MNLKYEPASERVGHAVYAICKQPNGGTVSFRVGLAVDWNTAQARWQRLDNRRIAGRRPIVKANRRQYVVDFYEVRAVDRHGRGLGAERHATALTVPYRKNVISR